MTTRAVIYTRASLDRTGEGLSVARQEKACRALARARGWSLVTVVSDTASAYSGRTRPGWDRVVGMVADRSADVVVAWAIDRMTRSMRDLEELIDLGVPIATVNGDLDLTNDQGRMNARILAAVARGEVERKSARHKAANEQRAKAGLPHGGGPKVFGYESDGMTLIPAEEKALVAAMDAVLAGEPLAVAARRLNEAGLFSYRKTKTGDSRWSAEGLRKALINPRYAGIRTHVGEEVGDAAWPAIITREKHLALRLLLEEASRKKGPGAGNKPINLMSGIATCSVCHRAVAGNSTAKGELIYSCKPGKHTSAPREEVDREVSAAVVSLLGQPGVLKELVTRDDTETNAARVEADEARKRLDELGEMFGTGMVDARQLAAATPPLRARLEAAEATLARAAGGNALEGIKVGTPHVAGQWEALSLARQRALVELLFEVELHPRRNGRWDTWNVDTHMTIVRRQRTEQLAHTA